MNKNTTYKTPEEFRNRLFTKKKTANILSVSEKTVERHITSKPENVILINNRGVRIPGEIVYHYLKNGF